MQPCRRCRHGSAVPGIDRLIPFAVGRLIAALDVWRQRHMTDAVDRIVDVDPLIRPEADGAATVKMTRKHFRVKPDVRPFEDDACADVELLPRVHQRFPQLEVPGSGGRQFTNQQALDSAAAGNAPAKKPRRKDPRVVEYEQIARLKVIAKLAKNRMLDVASVAMQYEQKVGIPTSCFGDTRYYVTGVSVVEDIPLAPGVVVPTTAPRSPDPGPLKVLQPK